MFEQAVNFFMPAAMRRQPAHPRYQEFRVLISTCLIGLPLMLLFPLPLYYMNKPVAGYLVNNALVIITLFSCRYLGHYRVPMTTTAVVTYFIIYGWIADTGLIYSPNVSLLHMYLLCAVWADKRYGWWAIFSNLAVFGYIFYRSVGADLSLPIQDVLGGPVYALVMNSLITIFFGGFLAYLQMDQERDRLKIKSLQEKKIMLLDEAVKERTSQLNSVREAIATDFHDETGNMLSAITRQATLLRTRLSADTAVLPIVESIIRNSNELYRSGKDFLWHLNHDSDDPEELFQYLTSYGQQYYNQFDIAFSVSGGGCGHFHLAPSAALNIIYIFKEGMTNVIKHSGATEVTFEMLCTERQLIFQLADNGTWKTTLQDGLHFGLGNMQKRSEKNDFMLNISKEGGTRLMLCITSNHDQKENSHH